IHASTSYRRQELTLEEVMNSSSSESVLPELKIRNATAVFLIVFGVFGNISFIAAVGTRREIRNKHGLHPAVIKGVAQSICLLFEALKLSKLAVAHSLTRESWFRVVFIHMIASTYQSIGIFIVGIDILISLIAPIKYFNLRNFPYLLYLQAPCVLLSAFFPIYTLSINEPDVPIGDLMAPRRKDAAMHTDGVCTKYELSDLNYGKIKEYFSANSQYQRRIVTSMVVFMFMLIPSLVCFSQSYYVHFIMSKDYRKAFLSSGIFSFVRLGRKSCERPSSTLSASMETKSRH
ncbi:hypothetical protein PRIPAC_80792, partial [Pristionchus pacificus]|uniref:G protein-coupled receptor n=1 Tax=Pristionchus pacificus TaxID=54126 RepID=A0A2A6BHC8_PRIPA